VKIEEIDVEKLGPSFSFRGKEAYLEQITISFQDALLVTASTGDANIYLTADIINSYGQEVRVVCLFEERTEERLRAERDKIWSPKPAPFQGEITGLLSDWVRGVGLTLYQCQALQNASEQGVQNHK
jgi:hypothetical protein